MFDFLGRLWNRHVANVGTIATLAALAFALSQSESGAVPKSAVEAIYAIALCLIAFFCFVQFYTSARAARVQEAISCLQTAVAKIAGESSAQHHEKGEKLKLLSTVMDDLSQAIGILTGTRCRSCVKIVCEIRQPAYPRLWARTLCRNTGYVGLETRHPIDRNTAFGSLLDDPNLTWFFGNDLPRCESKGRYRNTTEDWKDRYRSALVWPIIKQPQVEQNRVIAGFLCVDSRRTKPFCSSDFAIGAILADVLYPYLLPLLSSDDAARTQFQ